MTQEIKTLNRRLAEAFGSVGGNQRFAWKETHELEYFWRRNEGESYTRFTWADRPTGKVWVIAQWRPAGVMERDGHYTNVTREEWNARLHGQMPYPPNGMYHPFTETMLPRGIAPTAELTARWTHAMREQLARTEWEHHVRARDRADKQQEDHDTRWDDYVADQQPAFQNYKFDGTLRGDKPHVVYGGV